MVQKIETLIGPMNSGKSDELIRRLTREQIARNEIIVFKPKLDTRTENYVSSRSGKNLPAFPVESSMQLFLLFQQALQEFQKYHPKARIVIGIDEAQFFDHQLPEVLYDITHQFNCKVVVSGLSRDFRGEPFGPMPQILAMSQEIESFAALCTYIDPETKDQCNAEAYETYRSLNGEPCDYTDPIIVIGNITEGYEARCPNHHFVKNHPKRKSHSK